MFALLQSRIPLHSRIPLRSRSSFRCLLKASFVSITLFGGALAQTIDYNLNQAMRSISSITSSLQRLQASDQNGIKRLQKKIDKTIELLETSESKSHPDYQPTVQQVADLQLQLQQIAAGQPEESSSSETQNANASTQQSNTQSAATKPSTTTPTQPSNTSSAQAMDYNLNQAIRELNTIKNGLANLRQNDINGFNRLSVRLNKSAELLQTSESQAHPEFQPTVQLWTALQQEMTQIATALQQAQDQQQKLLAEQKAKEAAEAEQKKQAKAAEAAKLEEQKQLQARTAQEVLNPMSNKYSRESLPVLPDSPSPDQARAWATTMHALRTSQLQSDLALIDSLEAEGAAHPEDARNTKNWISSGAQHTIEENIRNARMQATGQVSSAKTFADMINAVPSDDMNGAYRFAREDRYDKNLQTLDNAILAGAVSDVFQEVFGSSDQNQSDELNTIAAARDKLVALKPNADKQAVVLENAEPAVRPKNKDFIMPIAQEFWLDGSIVAESDTDGSIWFDGDLVGYITHNGEIWVGGVEMGSLEPNGEVWFAGNRIGSVESNGEVWREGGQVGLIDQEGNAWINGVASGDVEPFKGEWRRAAIVYYYSDLFRER